MSEFENKKEEAEEITELTPQEYFEQVKERKHHITDEELIQNAVILDI